MFRKTRKLHEYSRFCTNFPRIFLDNARREYEYTQTNKQRRIAFVCTRIERSRHTCAYTCACVRATLTAGIAAAWLQWPNLPLSWLFYAVSLRFFLGARFLWITIYLYVCRGYILIYINMARRVSPDKIHYQNLLEQTCSILPT